jgi:hypothetical protein
MQRDQPPDLRYGTPPYPYSPPKRQRPARRVLISLAAGGLAALLAVAAYLLTQPEPEISSVGSLRLNGIGSFELKADNDAACVGTSGFEDITQGTQVTVYDAAGKVIATGSLGQGAVNETEGPLPTGCAFVFSVRVPASDYYGFEVSHRGKVTFTRSQVEADEVKLILGTTGG